MNTIIPQGSVLIRSLGWTLMHSLWQGAFIALCLWVVLKILQQAPARVKYHACLSALTGMAAWFVLTWIQQWQRLQAVVVHVTAATRDQAVEKSYTISSLPPDGSTESMVRYLMPDMEHLFPLIVAAYFSGLLLMLFRFGFGLSRLVRTRHSGISVPGAFWEQRLNELKDQLFITRTVKLRCSSRISMPVMMGVLKPVILLPAAMFSQLNVDQVEAILLHELAHIRRNDYLVNIFQIIAETLLFFNPFVWWISAGIRREREHCCDDLVLAQTQQPLPYATALAALEAFRNAAQPFSLAAGGQQHYLFNRIKRITEMKRNPLSYGRLAAALLIAGGIVTSIICFSPAFAQERKDKGKSSTATTTRIVIIDDKGNRREYGSVDELPQEEQVKLKKTLSKVKTNTYDTDEAALAGDDVPAPPVAPVAPIPPLPALPPMPPMAPMAPMPPSGISAEARAALAEASKALAAVDWKDINAGTRNALKAADKALKEVDWENIDRQIDQAMKQIDAVDWDEVAKAEGKGKSGRVYRQEIRQEVADARREAAGEIAAARREMLDARREALDARRERMEADREAANAHRVQVAVSAHAGPGAAQEYRKMLEEMEADGLIDRQRHFSIDKNSRDLYINGKEQPDAVKVKYRSYFPPGEVKISGSKNSLSISTTRSETRTTRN